MAGNTVAGPEPSGREAVWAAMRQERRFTIADLARLTKQPNSRVGDYVRSLAKAGVLAEAGREPSKLDKNYNRLAYTLAKDVGVDAPRVRKDGTLLVPSGRARMWRAMRILGSFSVKDLCAAASLEDAPVAEGEARTYCQFLANGGYLSRHDALRYRLVPARYTGPKPPMIRRVKELFDQNTGKVVWSQAREEDL